MATRLTDAEQQAVEAMREALATDRRAAAWALQELYDLQTPEEQAGEHPDEHNGVGFSKYDAEILQSFAVQLRSGFMLSARQWQVAHDRLPRYAAQLVRLGLFFDAENVAA